MGNADTGKKRRQRGMSVVELLVVITIIGILGSIGFMNIRSDKPQVNESAKIIAADMLWARSEAIRLNQPVLLSFYPEAERYVVTTEVKNGSATTKKTLLDRNLAKDFPLADLASVSFSGSGATQVSFDPRGLPRSVGSGAGNGTVLLTSSQDSSYSVKVALASQGRIQVEYP